jgi:hypothetical protein
MSYKYQLASDVIRDGLALELLSESGEVLAEVFRSDREMTTRIAVFVPGIPARELEQLIAQARDRLGTYEDGSPINEILQGDA